MDQDELERHMTLAQLHVAKANEHRDTNDLVSGMHELASAVRVLLRVTKRLWSEGREPLTPVVLDVEQSH